MRETPPSYSMALEAIKVGDTKTALVLLRQALLAEPRFAPAHFRLAMLLREQGDFDTALIAFGDALRSAPGTVDYLVNRAETLRRAGRTAEALADCNAAAALAPRHFETSLIRGVVHHDRGERLEAIADLTTATRHDPRSFLAWKLLGRMLKDAQRSQEALEALRTAHRLDKRDSETLRLIGDLCDATGRTEEAFSAYRDAITLNPDDVTTYVNLSGLLCRTKLLDVVLTVTQVGLKLAPHSAELHCNRALALELLGRRDEATFSYAEAVRCNPEAGPPLLSLCRLRASLCQWQDLDLLWDCARQLTIERGCKTSPFAFLSHVTDLPTLLRANTLWAESLKTPVIAHLSPRPCNTGKRLHIGYVSADFHDHATAILMADLLECHDKSRFHVTGYSIGPHDEGAMRTRIVRALDRFRDLEAMSHDDAAAKIAADGIDILIDLKGYTYQSRPGIFARRPAPIQVNFLGYPATMGAPFIDYIIGDATVTPHEHAPHYSERIVQLPHSYQPNDRKRPRPSPDVTRSEFGLPDDAFVFCCFNANFKITPQIFDVWARLLHRVADSVLWLYRGTDAVAASLTSEAAARGIDPARLYFAPKLPFARHLSRVALADLFLDTTPYGAHTTASDALWAGVPVVTVCGQTFSSRVGASLLNAVGLPKLVARDLKDYEAKALHLARHRDELADFKRHLRESPLDLPLFDTPRYTRALEAAFETMLLESQRAS